MFIRLSHFTLFHRDAHKVRIVPSIYLIISVFIKTAFNLICAGQEKRYEVRKRRLMKGKSVPHYAAVEPQGKGVMVASEKPFTFIQVDGVPLEDKPPEDMDMGNAGQ